MHTDPELRRRIEAFRLDDPQSSFPFSARLARDMCWTRSHAGRCISEYRRFVYLACIAGHPVTPSDDVDAVWHLHLTYSRSYWRDMCASVLHQPLHHGPTRGGVQEAIRYRDQYEATLATYRSAFGEEPPADIWPASDVRFAPERPMIVNRQTHWVIPKQPFRAFGRAIRSKAAAVAVLIGSTGLAAAAGSNETFLGLSPTQQYIAGGALAVVVLFWAFFIQKPGKRKKGGSGCSSGCGSNGSDGDSGCSGCGGD